MPGASTRRTVASAIGAGHPHPVSSCQYANAPSIPIAPWAKLKMPVVVYVSTRPLAARAKMDAVVSPRIVSRRNSSIGCAPRLDHPPENDMTLPGSQL
jgi:hypothetical protein